MALTLSNLTVPLHYTIVSPVLMSPSTLGSAVFTGPAMQIALEEVNEIYRDRLNFSLLLLADPRMADCFSSVVNVQDVFSEFIYRPERMGKGNSSEVIAIVAPGLLTFLYFIYNVLYRVALYDFMKCCIFNWLE